MTQPSQRNAGHGPWGLALAVLAGLGGGCGEAPQDGPAPAAVEEASPHDDSTAGAHDHHDHAEPGEPGEPGGAEPAERRPRVDRKAPGVTVLSPRRGAAPGKVLFAGTISDTSFPCRIRIADTVIPVEEGPWEHELELEMGEQLVLVEAFDAAGNNTFFTMVVPVYPGHDSEDKRQPKFVSNAQELANAIEDQKIIVLHPGEYDLNDVNLQGNQRLRRSDESEGDGVVLHSTKKLRLIGPPERTAILRGGSSGSILTVADCDSIQFENLAFAPRPDGGGLSSYVTVRHSYGVQFENCELSGGAQVGMRLVRVNKVDVIGCLLEGCTEGMLFFKNSKHIGFEDTEFRENTGSYGFSFRGRDIRHISFLGCRIQGNELSPDAGIFDFDGGMTEILFREGVVDGNTAASFAVGAGKERLVTRASQIQSFGAAED